MKSYFLFYFFFFFSLLGCTSSYQHHVANQNNTPTFFISPVQNHSVFTFPTAFFGYLKKELCHRLTEPYSTVFSEQSSSQTAILASKKEARFSISMQCLTAEITTPFTLSILVNMVDQTSSQKKPREKIFSTSCLLEDSSFAKDPTFFLTEENHLKTSPLGLAATKLAKEIQHTLSEWMKEEMHSLGGKK